MQQILSGRRGDRRRVEDVVHFERARSVRDKNYPSRRRQFSFLHSFFVLLFVSLLIGAWPMTVLAQSPGNLRVPPPDFPEPQGDTLDESEELPELDLPEVQTSAVRKVIVDTDPGVDDAAALIWLLTQQRYPLNFQGIVTVAGNTSVENATNTVLTLLEWTERPEIPVVQGADAPSNVPRSRTGQLIHGPDGLWGISFGNPHDLSGIETDATGFYCDTDTDTATLSLGTLVIALGPLTNLAAAINECPSQWDGVEVVSLGGAKFGGNQTPVTEYNYWQDPAAASTVFGSTISTTLGVETGYQVQMVPLEAFSQLKLRRRDLRIIEKNGNTAIQNLLPALDMYIQSVSEGGPSAPLPDVVAAMLALDNRFGRSESALVKVTAGPDIPELIRGQTVVGLNFNERITMIVDDAKLSELADRVFMDPDFNFIEFFGELELILANNPDNAAFVTDIRAVLMYVAFIFDVMRSPSNRGISSSGDPAIEDTGAADSGAASHELYIPLVGAE